MVGIIGGIGAGNSVFPVFLRVLAFSVCLPCVSMFPCVPNFPCASVFSVRASVWHV